MSNNFTYWSLILLSAVQLQAQSPETTPNVHLSPYSVWGRGKNWKLNSHPLQYSRVLQKESEFSENNEKIRPKDWQGHPYQEDIYFFQRKNSGSGLYTVGYSCLYDTPESLFTEYPINRQNPKMLYRGNQASAMYQDIFESIYCICSRHPGHDDEDIINLDIEKEWGKKLIFYQESSDCGAAKKTRKWWKKLDFFMKNYDGIRGIVYAPWGSKLLPSKEQMAKIDTYFYCNTHLPYKSGFPSPMGQVRHLFISRIDEKVASKMLKELAQMPNKLSILYLHDVPDFFSTQLFEQQQNLEVLTCGYVSDSALRAFEKLRRLKILSLAASVFERLAPTLLTLDSLDYINIDGHAENWTSLIQHPSLRHLQINVRTSQPYPSPKLEPDFFTYKEDDVRAFVKKNERVIVFKVEHNYQDCGPHATRQVFEHVLRLRAAGAIVLMNGITTHHGEDITSQRSLNQHTGKRLEIFYAEYDLYFEVHREAIEQRVANGLKKHQNKATGKENSVSEIGFLYEADGQLRIDYGLYLVHSGILEESEHFRDIRCFQYRRGLDVID